MERVWRIFVAVAIVAMMSAPNVGTCLPLNQPDHACCASEMQMAAQHCCPDAAPQLPVAAVSHADCASGFQISSAIFVFTRIETLSVSPIVRASSLPNQPPDTILRT